MSGTLDLIIAINADGVTADLRLLDEHGTQLAHQYTDFAKIAASRRLGLFDLQNYLRNYVESSRQPTAAAEIGVCIAEEVLGKDIFLRLWRPISQRTLRIQLPSATEQRTNLAAALARVPWEIARPATDQPSLEERSLLVRVVHQMEESNSEPLRLGQEEHLRLLFIFAEARDSRPLAMRREWQQLRQMLRREVYPKRRVVAHILSHGVTRDRLRAQIQENNGYHIVHWSGHGHVNLLELAKSDGSRDTLSGQALLDLFVQAGGFIPRLFLLSACHSGEILRITDWADFIAAAQDEKPITREAIGGIQPKEIQVDEAPGYTGTAHALLEGGVPSVVAMRYAVGDEYARELSVEFYRALLAHAAPKSVAAALTMAKNAMRHLSRDVQARFAVGDYATPVLYGAAQPGLTPQTGRGIDLEARNPRLHQLPELTISEHTHFVGRTWELAGLGAQYIGSTNESEAKVVAVITGLGGMGKTALSAEALALWEQRFQWVLIYQAKPQALQFEATLNDIHAKLSSELGRYYEHVRTNPADAIYRPATQEFTGAERFKRLTSNLIRALRDEPILLVLDNFETNLREKAELPSTGGSPYWAARDPEWDSCFGRLAEELIGTPSRLLITSRRPLTICARSTVHTLRLGPLPPNEAALYLREHTGLGQMVFGFDESERKLAIRLLTASRFHPLLMDRLARLASGGPSMRQQFLQALETLERSSDYSKLPALFGTDRQDLDELRYLDDALALSIDFLIESACRDARCVLWIVALANDVETLELVREIWTSLAGRQDADFEPLLRYLTTVGLATALQTKPEDADPSLTCHELVRERIRVWMENHTGEQGDFLEDAVRIAFAERFERAFQSVRTKDMTSALECGRRAIVYYAEARAYERLRRFALGVVITAEARLLTGLLPHLQSAARSAQTGPDRWGCLLLLADALDNSGRTDESMPFYHEAAALAKLTAEREAGLASAQAWMDYSTIIGNWAIAYQHIGQLTRSKELQHERTEAQRKAGAAEVYLLSSKLEALRNEVLAGASAKVLVEIKNAVSTMEHWWELLKSGASLPEIPHPEQFPHLYLNALDVALQAHVGVEDWGEAERLSKTKISIRKLLRHSEEDIAVEYRNLADILIQQERYEDAQKTIEACLEVYSEASVQRARIIIVLSNLLRQQGDAREAILQARRALAISDAFPSPDDRCVAHHTLADCLQNRGEPPDLSEAARHFLAAAAYVVGARLEQRGEVFIGYFAYLHRNQRGAGTGLHLKEILADPAFHVLKNWLQELEVDPEIVEASISKIVETFRQVASNKHSS